MEPAIDIERFAALSAELDAGTPRDELCAREGLAVGDWVAAQETWLSRMAEETARKRFVLTNRYNAVFVARRRTITHGGPPKRATPARAPVASSPVAPAASASVAPVASGPVAPPPLATPTYEAPSFARAAEPAPFLASRPEPSFVEPVFIEPSFIEPAGVPPPPIVPPAVLEPMVRPSRAATVAVPVFTEPVTALPFASADGAGSVTETGPSPLAIARVALPFKPPPPGPPAPPPPQAAPRDVPPRPPSADLSGTVVGVSPFATSGTALPFKHGAPAGPPPPDAAARPPADNLLAGTVAGVLSPFAAGASPLPFQASAGAPTRPAATQASGGLPFQGTPAEQPPPPPPPPRAATPAAGSPAARPALTNTPREPRLTLEQFASLSAEIAVNPRGAAQIRERYGFDEASHRAESEAHNRRFNADKSAYSRYLELFQSFREYVARSQR